MTPRIRTLAARTLLAIAGASCGAMAGHAAQDAYAGHGVGIEAGQPGTCDRIPTSYLTCRTNYLRGQTMAVRDIRQFTDPSGTDWSTYYVDPLDDAEESWRRADGPQWISGTPEPNDTWNFIKAVPLKGDLDHKLLSDVYARTYSCNENRPLGIPACDTGGLGNLDIQWAEIYLNDSLLPAATIAIRQSTMAHELGHSLGLAHHDAPELALMDENDFLLAPSEIDLGSTTECRTPNWDLTKAQSWGIRCIYDWYGYSKVPPGATPTRTAVATATATPAPCVGICGGGGGGGGDSSGKVPV